MSNVKVTANEAGTVIVISENNPEYGHIRVEQNRVTIGDDGWVRNGLISALVPGEVKDLQALGWEADQELPGGIHVKESLEPFNKKDPERDYKVAGKTGVICSIEDQPIYRKTFYTAAGTIGDETLEHDNGEAIKAKHAELEAAKTGEPAEAGAEEEPKDEFSL